MMPVREKIKEHGALLYTIIGRVIQIAIGLGTLKLLTFYLSKEQVGEYGLFLNIVTLLVFVAIRPLNQYFNRRLHEWFESGNLPTVLKRITLIQLGMGLGCVPIVILGAAILSIHSTTPLYLWAIVWSCWFFFSSVFNTVVPAFNLLGYKLQWVLNNSFGLCLGLAIAWAAVLIAPTALNWTAALALGFLLSSAAALHILVRIGRQRPRKPEQLGKVILLSFLIPATVAVGGIWIQFQAFRLFVVGFMPMGEYGLFTAGYGLAAGVMAALEGLAAQYLQPFFYSALLPTVDDASKNRQWSIFAGTMMTLTGGTALLAIVYGPMLCKLLLSHTFQNAWPYFFIGIFIEAIRVVSGATSLGTHVTMQVQRSLRSYISGIIALAAGMALGKIFHSQAVFTTVVILGCCVHILVLTMDVSRHLKVAITIPSLRYFLALAAIVAIFVVSIVMGANMTLQFTLIGIASILYALLVFDVNSHLPLSHGHR